MNDREGNPFLIPPPPRREPVTALDREPDAAGAADPPPGQAARPDQALITLPPGLVDSATFRSPNPRAQRITDRPAPPLTRTPSEEIVFFPAAPGVPPATTPADDTVRRPAAPTGSTASTGWTLSLPDGTVPLTGTTFLGRDPAPTSEHPHAGLLRLNDPAKSVSKTHAVFDVDGDGLWVRDLDSTNGVWVAGADGQETRVAAGERVRLTPGARVELGEFPIDIIRG